MSTQPSESLADATLSTAISVFEKQKKLGERAIAQLDDEQLFVVIDPEANSVATIVKHVAGNMRSRWSEFLTTDGEKPDRNRDGEFVLAAHERTRDTVVAWWNGGWAILMNTLATLKPGDLTATVLIRGEKMPAIAAIFRQIDHYGQHIGQIVLLAKHLKGTDWQTLSIPKGKSAEVEAMIRAQIEAQQG